MFVQFHNLILSYLNAEGRLTPGLESFLIQKDFESFFGILIKNQDLAYFKKIDSRCFSLLKIS